MNKKWNKRLEKLDEAAALVAMKVLKEEQKAMVQLIKDFVSVMTMVELTVAEGVELNSDFTKLLESIYTKWPGLEEVISAYTRMVHRDGTPP